MSMLEESELLVRNVVEDLRAIHNFVRDHQAFESLTEEKKAEIREFTLTAVK